MSSQRSTSRGSYRGAITQERVDLSGKVERIRELRKDGLDLGQIANRIHMPLSEIREIIGETR